MNVGGRMNAGKGRRRSWMQHLVNSKERLTRVFDAHEGVAVQRNRQAYDRGGRSRFVKSGKVFLVFDESDVAKTRFQ